jgi:putative Mn2+ efflux pump MntP
MMPLVGYACGNLIYDYINKYSHWVTFILLFLIGCKMIYEAYSEEECERTGRCEFNTNLIMLAIATSIDALAIGFSLAMIRPDNILFIISVIGIITFGICASGVFIGNKIGKMFSMKSELFGGVVLILIGLKTLIENFI